MGSGSKPASRLLLIAAFGAVACSAGLQWTGLLSQSEAARQRATRDSLMEFSTVLNDFGSAPRAKKPELAAQLTTLAEALSDKARSDSLAPGSRRVGTLAAYEVRELSRGSELQERLRAEIRDLAGRADTLESVALRRAALFGKVNLAVLGVASILSGLVLIRARRANLTSMAAPSAG